MVAQRAASLFWMEHWQHHLHLHPTSKTVLSHLGVKILNEFQIAKRHAICKHNKGKKMKTTIKLLFATASFALLTACGGGGGGGIVEQITPPTLDLRTAWGTYFQSNSSRNITISGTVDGNSVSGNGTSIISYSSPTSVLIINPQNSFMGPSVNLTNVSKTTLTSSLTLTVNGNQGIVSSTEEYYFDANGVLKMRKDVDDNEQTIITSFTNLPTQVTAGSAGTLYSGTVYSRSGYTCGTESAAYSVSSESNTSLIVILTISQNTTNQTFNECSASTSTTQNRYRLTASGITQINSAGSSSVASGMLTITYN